jgi:hypothetical protein
MAKSIKEIPKKRGRPATGKDPLVTARLPQDMIASLDAYAERDGVTRSEVMRRLIEAGLKRRPKV